MPWCERRRSREARARAVAMRRKKHFRFSVEPIGEPRLVISLSLLLLSLSSYRGMSTPAASQAAMTLAPLGMVTVLPLTVHSMPSTTGAGAGAGVAAEASERAKEKSMLPLLSLLLFKLLALPLLLPLVLAAAPPSARAAARRAAARAARSIFEGEFLKVKRRLFSFFVFLASQR